AGQGQDGLQGFACGPFRGRVLAAGAREQRMQQANAVNEVDAVRVDALETYDRYGKHLLNDRRCEPVELLLVQFGEAMVMPLDLLRPDALERISDGVDRGLHSPVVKRP